jgi:PilZ domain
VTAKGKELRTDKRRDLGAGGSVRVHILIGKESISAKTVDMSPGGIGIITKELRQSKLPVVSQRVELVYRKGTERELVVKAAVRNINFNLLGDHVLVRIGLSYGHQDEDEIIQHSAEEKAAQDIVACPDFFRPSAFCADPMFFQERLHFLAAGLLGAKQVHLSGRCASSCSVFAHARNLRCHRHQWRC